MAAIDRILNRLGVIGLEMVAFKDAMVGVAAGDLDLATLDTTGAVTIGATLDVTGVTTLHDTRCNKFKLDIAGTAAAQQTGIADIGNSATGTQIATAVNAIITVLETFGFTATV